MTVGHESRFVRDELREQSAEGFHEHSDDLALHRALGHLRGHARDVEDGMPDRRTGVLVVPTDTWRRVIIHFAHRQRSWLTNQMNVSSAWKSDPM
jgi:hypothetical protein